MKLVEIQQETYRNSFLNTLQTLIWVEELTFTHY